jgi:hypothetical protein
MEPPITGHDAVSHKMTVRMNWREDAACGGTDIQSAPAKATPHLT